MSIRILTGDCREVLRSLPDESVHCVVTSPPYFGLRDYGVDGQIGLEPSPGEFVDALVGVFQEVRRVLRGDGTVWLNLGDSYARDSRVRWNNSLHTERDWKCDQAMRNASNVVRDAGLKPKDLIGIPWRVAFALQADGWWLRQDIIWSKPNPMPESVTDRCTKAHEYLFLLSKGEKYYFDAEGIRELASSNRPDMAEKGLRTGTAYLNGNKDNSNKPERKARDNFKRDGSKRAEVFPGQSCGTHRPERPDSEYDLATRNKRSVWTVATQAFKEAHFACVDDQTEALTPAGWKLHPELQNGDVIAAYSQESARIEWQRATFHRYPFAADMIAIEKRESSQRLTPNHRCLVRRRVSGVGVVEAKDLKPGMQVPVIAPLHIAQESASLGPDMCKLLGWYLTEGEKKRGSIIRISQSASANPDKVESIRALLNRMQADFHENTRRRTWRGRPSIEVTFSVSGTVANDLYLISPRKLASPAWVNWPASDIEAFLNAVIDGDGHRRRDGRRCIVQKDRGFLDVIQMMALRLGWRGSLAPRRGGDYVLYLTEGQWLTLRSANGAHKPLKTERYVGTVWCPSVPATFWLARRSGKTFITGNTFPPALIEPCILAGCPEGGTVLDPFGGAGTTALVADRLQRNSILIELNPAYADMARKRVSADATLLTSVAKE